MNGEVKSLKVLETIVVEGRDDETAVKQAVDAEVIITNGFGIKASTFERIKWASEKNGVIIFTDPDWAGEKIRTRINERIPGCKNAYLVKDEALKNENIGVENAKPKSIIDALLKAKVVTSEINNEFTMEDLIENRLSGSELSSFLRTELGKILRIGYGNSKQFLKRLNHYKISRDEFYNGLDRIFSGDDGQI